ncbi:hypothetical protein E3Q17_01997 [Wallemia mellicola]|uniref:Maintenance of telomere capping protein 1 n=1 Tax=Wallemia mellicola TaxID=1708541 RepID=A0A4T0NUJ0_9BASI|nr:hypothetical protein E3Q17_01997 [Wallemia mellicola]TIC11607.1 hypothetical protein E3Q14_02204 [Wallemia mellicola]
MSEIRESLQTIQQSVESVKGVIEALNNTLVASIVIIDKLVSAASGAQEEQDSVDPLAFKPNPSALLNKNAKDDNGNENDEEENDGVYRPPKLAAVPYTDPEKTKKDKKKVIPAAILPELVGGNEVTMQSSSGLADVPSKLSSRRARELQHMQDYEEENFTRLVQNRKDANRRLRDEADIALGGSGVMRGRRVGGLDGEFDDVLRAVDSRPSKSKNGRAGIYDELDKLSKKSSALDKASAKRARGETANTIENEKKTTRSKEVLSFLDQLDTDLKTPGAAISVSQDSSHEKEHHPESEKYEEPQSAQTEEAEKTIQYLQNLALKKNASSPRLDDKTPTGSPTLDKGKQRETASEEHIAEKPTGWGSWFSAAQTQAQAALAQAKHVAEQTTAKQNAMNALHAANAPEWKNKIGGLVKGAGLDKIAHDLAEQGKHALSDIYNAVVPPISDAELLEVWVSHDMVGYDGITDVVYSGLSKHLDLIQGGELIVNSQKTDKEEKNRNLNLLDNISAALQLTEERLNALIEAEEEVFNEKKKAEQGTSSEIADEKDNEEQSVKRTHIKLRVQPYIERSARPQLQITSVEGGEKEDVRLRFLITLVDKAHGLQCSSYSQSLPLSWLEEEEKRVDEDKMNYLMWIENTLIGVLKGSIENISIDYLRKRKIDVTKLSSNNIDWTAAQAQIPISDY